MLLSDDQLKFLGNNELFNCIVKNSNNNIKSIKIIDRTIYIDGKKWKIKNVNFHENRFNNSKMLCITAHRFFIKATLRYVDLGKKVLLQLPYDYYTN